MNSPVRMLAIRQKTLIWFDDVKSDCDHWWLRRAVSEIVLTREASGWILLFRQCGRRVSQYGPVEPVRIVYLNAAGSIRPSSRG